MSTARTPRTDSDIIDEIALYMGCRKRWTLDTLDGIADLIGNVRPHPDRHSASTYRQTLERHHTRQVAGHSVQHGDVGDGTVDGSHQPRRDIR